jgi:mono/diheme cytochrome c family protein
MRYVSHVVLWLVLLAAGVGVWVWSGSYEMGADRPHWPLTEWAVKVLRERSIQRQAHEITPPALDDPAMIRRGAEHYAAMCSACHLTPAIRQTELRTGLYPQPPDLAEHGIHDPAEAFWKIKHGIKMSAMPAWGKSHSDAAIWDMVAFLRQLPKLDEAQFEALAGSAGNDGHGGMSMHGHGHADPHDHDAPAAPGSAASMPMDMPMPASSAMH